MLGPGDDLDFGGNPLLGDAADAEPIGALGVGWGALLAATIAGVVARAPPPARERRRGARAGPARAARRGLDAGRLRGLLHRGALVIGRVRCRAPPCSSCRWRARDRDGRRDPAPPALRPRRLRRPRAGGHRRDDRPRGALRGRAARGRRALSAARTWAWRSPRRSLVAVALAPVRDRRAAPRRARPARAARRALRGARRARPAARRRPGGRRRCCPCWWRRSPTRCGCPTWRRADATAPSSRTARRPPAWRCDCRSSTPASASARC